MPKAFIDGRIYVRYRPLEIAEAILVDDDGRVMAVGGRDDVLGLARSVGAEVFSLGGGTVLPGFVDAHMHLDSLGILLSTVDLRGCRSIGELVERTARAVESTPFAKWVIGHGWDQDLFVEKRWPTRHDIDLLTTEKAVLLARICMHAAVLNTRAIRETGLWESAVPGVERDANGEPTGVVKGEAFSLAWRVFENSLTTEELENIVERAVDYALSQGVTTLGFVSCNQRTLRSMSNLERRGALKARIRVYISARDYYEKRDEVLNILKEHGSSKNKLRVKGVKELGDGSLGARTAWLSAPYADDSSTSGTSYVSDSWLREIAALAEEDGLQLAIHGIGDKAVETILRLYSQLPKRMLLRHRIEHASVLREDLIKEIASLKTPLVVQPRFVISDWWIIERLGVERAKYAYPFKTLVERGVPIALSTDAPIEPLNPWETVYAAVTRGWLDEIPLSRLTPGEKLSLEEALYYYTAGSSYAMGEEEHVGMLEKGYYADFIVVDRDPFATPPRDLRNIKVLATYVGGEKVFETGD